MRVVLAHRFFPPDTPACGRLFNELYGFLKEEGVDCNVVTAQPAYVESDDKSPAPEVIRFPLILQKSTGFLGKAISGVHFLICFICWGLLRVKRGDFVIISTIPPVLSGAAGMLLQKIKGAKLIYWCMDIHPEVAADTYGRFTGLLKRIDTFVVRRAHRVVVLSEEMQRTLEEARNGGETLGNTEVIPCRTQLDSPAGKGKSESNSEKLSIIFAGNMGEFQSLPEVIEGLKRSERTDLRFTFIGRGTMLEPLRKRVQELELEDQVTFEGFMASEELAIRLQTADYGLVSLSPKVSKYAFPSKFTSLLSQGLPVVAVADEDSDLVSLVRKWKIGVASDQSPGEIAKALKRLPVASAQTAEMPGNVEACFQKNFSEAVINQKWKALLEN